MTDHERIVYLYGLFDPREPKRITYVGKTNNPKYRLKDHVVRARYTKDPLPKDLWIRELRAAGVKPGMRILATASFTTWPEKERELIERYRAANPSLLNIDDGGKGARYLTAGARRQKRAIYIELLNKIRPGRKS